MECAQERKGKEEAKTLSIFLNICSLNELADQCIYHKLPLKNDVSY